MALHVLDEANRCLGYKAAVPAGLPHPHQHPEVIRLLKDNHLDDAGRMLFENNPDHCVRPRVQPREPVRGPLHPQPDAQPRPRPLLHHRGLHLHHLCQQDDFRPRPKNGMKAAVVSSGPAGLTVAVLLARWGYDVTIFDARDKIGGVMRYGIPNYRLPDSVLDDFQYRHLELKGIHVRPNTAIGKTITIDDLFRDGYKSVFIGAGLWKANAMHIKGETLGNVAFGIDYLANSRPSSWATTSPSSAWATPPWTAPALPSATAHATSPATPAATRVHQRFRA